jgi:hypothetical protein
LTSVGGRNKNKKLFLLILAIFHVGFLSILVIFSRVGLTKQGITNNSSRKGYQSWFDFQECGADDRVAQWIRLGVCPVLGPCKVIKPGPDPQVIERTTHF